jgi:acetylornithine/succinyldiaminopimelate/putrescine aminotransferase
LHLAGALAVPSGTHIIRLLPALNLRPQEAAEGLGIIESVVAQISP